MKVFFWVSASKLCDIGYVFSHAVKMCRKFIISWRTNLHRRRYFPLMCSNYRLWKIEKFSLDALGLNNWIRSLGWVRSPRSSLLSKTSSKKPLELKKLLTKGRGGENFGIKKNFFIMHMQGVSFDFFAKNGVLYFDKFCTGRWLYRVLNGFQNTTVINSKTTAVGGSRARKFCSKKQIGP